jgi:hypothetical protein
MRLSPTAEPRDVDATLQAVRLKLFRENIGVALDLVETAQRCKNSSSSQTHLTVSPPVFRNSDGVPRKIARCGYPASRGTPEIRTTHTSAPARSQGKRRFHALAEA